MNTFNLKTVDDNEPLVNDPFYAWLDANASKHDVSFDNIVKYLESLGFVKGKDSIDEQQLKTLEYVLETWGRLTPWFPPCKYDELFSAGKDYFLWVAEPGSKRVNATKKLLDMVREAGWIYDPHPDNLYFQVTGNKLYANAQQILASRFLCVVEDLK